MYRYIAAQEQIDRQQAALSQQYQQLTYAQAEYETALKQAKKAQTQAEEYHDQLEVRLSIQVECS